VHGHTRILEFDDDLNALALLASTEVEQRVLIQTKLGENTLEVGRVFRHSKIVDQQ
jgi:hypothetical protein